MFSTFVSWGKTTKDGNLTESNSIERADHSFAVVTPTYLPDLKRCELLAESLDRCAPQVPHYLIVDRCDRSAFRHLEREQRQLIESEALVGNWMLRMPGRKGFWLSLKGAAGAWLDPSTDPEDCGDSRPCRSGH